VEEDGEEVADVREGRKDHACDGLCGKFMESKSVKLKKEKKEMRANFGNSIFFL
jgi:hypothetical protein